MTFIKTSRARHYAAAVLAVAVATALRLALDPVIGQRDVLFAFVLAIVFATFTGGRGPGLLATALSVPVVMYFSVEPRFSFVVYDPTDVVRLVVLAATGVGISLVGKSMHGVDEHAPEADLRALTRLYRALIEGFFGGA